MLEITNEDISKLNDSDLSSLVGRLCEAELRKEKLPISGVTYGGHQDEADGGIDVNVEVHGEFEGTGFIPRSLTGFQVKKPDMKGSSISKEMRPKSKLRDSIKKIGLGKGAYIIVSGHSSLTDLKLKNRKEAMADAVSDFTHKKDLFLDFYDSDRLATWVRCHPSLIFWVKNKIGALTFGWQSFRNWSRNSDDTEEAFLVDEDVRIYLGDKTEENSKNTVEGINLIRTELSNTNSSVRFVGLSGFGKTRFLQALFDERIGENALNPYQVIYGDVQDNLTPDPQTFARQLVALRQPIILSVDNCTPNLHRQLTTVCMASSSLVKLITVEYDIKEDQPEETKVFRIGRISDELLAKIIHQRYRHIGWLNRDNIIEFSGGNPRIAFALANTIKQGDSIGKLTDNELFKRLFFQRNALDESLMRSAEVCSLVYSFDISTSEGEDEEMTVLSDLAEKTKRELYSDVSTLLSRDLIQKRNKWRAVLPHAIANKLASSALQNIPLEDIVNAFEESSERLLKSFAHRLNFLQKSPKAKEIAKKWLSETGFLGKNFDDLNALGIKLLNFIALLDPEVTLNAIERAMASAEKSSTPFPKSYQVEDFAKIVGALAYDGTKFERCVNILVKFYLSDESKREWLEQLLESLFFILNSKTHAPLSVRLPIVLNLIKSPFLQKQHLGFRLLNSLLRAKDLRPFHNNSIFNKHFKDYGYHPKGDKEQIEEWYSSVLEICEPLIKNEDVISEKVKATIAKNIRMLWSTVGYPALYDQLEAIFEFASKEKTWVAGWISIRETIRFHGEKLLPEGLERLQKIEQEFRPIKLIDKVRVYALSKEFDAHSLLFPEESDGEDWWKKLVILVKEMGTQLVNEEADFKKLLTELVFDEASYRSRGYYLGQGIAIGTKNPLKTWEDLKQVLLKVPDDNKCFFVIRGFLWEISQKDALITEKILDEALENEQLNKAFIILQAAVKTDKKGWGRVMNCLENDKAPIHIYGTLLNSNFDELTYYDDLSNFLEMLILKEGGMKIAIDFLGMKVFNRSDVKKNLPNNRIKSFARIFLTKIEFKRNVDYLLNSSHWLEIIIEGCFDKDYSREGKILCENMVKASLAFEISLSNFPGMINSLARCQPRCFLNNFLETSDDSIAVYRQEFTVGFDSYKSPLFDIDNEVILEWCDDKPESRYPEIAASIQLFYPDSKTADALIVNPLAIKLLQKAPDILPILDNFSRSFIPLAWSGSLNDALQLRIPLLEHFKSHENPKVVEWVDEMGTLIQERIESENKRQKFEYRNTNERFEY